MLAARPLASGVARGYRPAVTRTRAAPPREDAGGAGAALAFAALAAVGALALYLVHPISSGFRLPVGPDGPVYTWLARLAADSGLGDAPGAGPGVPALTAGLASALRIEAVQAVTLLGPVLAVACGLAGAALLESALGSDARRAAAGVALTAAFTAYLAGGWLANVAMAATFLAALAALAVPSGRSPVWLAGGLIAAGGLAHGIFLGIGVLVLVVLAVIELTPPGRGPAEVARARRIALAAGAGSAVALAGIAWIGAGPALQVDTSQDGFLRRAQLRTLLLDRYRERLRGDVARARIPVLSAAALAAAWLAFDREEEGRRPFLRLVAAWAIVTLAGAGFLAMTGLGPANRMVQFAFVLPIAGAAGAGVLLRRGWVTAIVAAALVAVFVWTALAGWGRQSPALEGAELAAVARASDAVATAPPGTPLVFVVDTSQLAAAYHVTRMANVIRGAVDPSRIPDVRVAVGAPGDYLDGTRDPRGDREYGSIADAYARETEVVHGREIALVLRRFNPRGWVEAVRGGREVAPGVVVLPTGASDLARGETAAPTRWGLGPVALAALCLATLGALAAVGGGWAWWGLRSAGPRAAALAAPSAGVGVTILGSVAADRVGALPGSIGALLGVLLLAAAGYVLATRR